ncbi:transmembrane protein 17B [Gallus gallus]|uniref:transmembrane protein 17B n=1 Tax=Gallus gallus TaxID=9031 RepID=UPI001AE4F8A7|nr:transmembrane protein 17B [Gallus gallus]
MAAHTPLPPNLRRGLTAFSSAIFTTTKTWDSSTAHLYHPVHEVLASLPLQGWGPAWGWQGQGCALLQYNLLPRYYQLLLLAAFLILTLAEGARLYLGYIGNLQEKVPELAGFLLLSLLIQLPLLLFLLTDHLTIRLPLELAVHSLLLAFLICEVVAAFLALRVMSRQLAAQFYLRQFKVGSWGDAAGHDPPH